MKRRILIMSPDDSLARELKDIGEVLWIPIIELKPIEGSSLRALEALRVCNRVMLTSPRTLKILLEDASRHGVGDVIFEALKSSYIAVNGPKTAEEVWRILGRRPDYIASKPYSKILAGELSVRVDCIVALRSSEAVRDADEIFKTCGVRFYDIPVYEPTVRVEMIEAVKEVICKGRVDVALLTSPMIARIFCEAITICPRHSLKIIVMGETTFKNTPQECRGAGELIIGDGTPKSVKDALVK
ncbi:MAG: uroporphyrinogen-III synthase [Thermoprotei archaeon]|nr:uroporphyrinogen-III synthase [Thermoprotei archaeon]